MVVDSAGSSSPRQTLFHEYVHLLMRKARNVPIPRWYDEGFADFLSTTERRANALVVGGIPRSRGQWLLHRGRLSLSELLEPAPFSEYSEDEIGRFYAGAWLLVHFLVSQHEDPDGLGFGERMDRYLEAYEAGVPSIEAFEGAWDVPLERLENMIDEPIRSGFRKAVLSLESIRFDDEVAIRPMDSGEIAFRLGELALSIRRVDVARPLLELARSADPDDAQVLAALGRSAAAEGRIEEAAALLDRAIELAPRNVPGLLDRARFWLARSDETPESVHRTEALAAARRDSRRAFDEQPDHPEVLWIYALSNLMSDQQTAEAFTPWVAILEGAWQVLPADRQTSYSLSEVYLELGRQTEAERIARRLLLQAHGREGIEEIEMQLERAARDRSAQPPAPTHSQP
ncbi:MAG: tetratricopeptide repeat protein [bacterium]